MDSARATILPTHTPDDFARSAAMAARAILEGQVVALPTETVYGLAADGTNPDAVRQIFAIKGRPSHNPLILHVAGVSMAKQFCQSWPETAQQLADAYWPGPLTLVLKKAPNVPDIVTAGGDTVALRWPSHPFIQSVIRQSGKPLAAPSANLSNRVSPTSPEHVDQQLGDRIALIVDGGHCQVGIESTVVDLTVSPPRILRPGMIHEESLAAVIGEVVSASSGGDATLKSPGQLLKHYSPNAKLRLLKWADESEFKEVISKFDPAANRVHVIAHTHVPMNPYGAEVSVIPHDAEAFARALYTELHRCDGAKADWILIEELPQTTEWSGIRDRLVRAAQD